MSVSYEIEMTTARIKEIRARYRQTLKAELAPLVAKVNRLKQQKLRDDRREANLRADAREAQAAPVQMVADEPTPMPTPIKPWPVVAGKDFFGAMSDWMADKSDEFLPPREADYPK